MFDLFDFLFSPILDLASFFHAADDRPEARSLTWGCAALSIVDLGGVAAFAFWWGS